MAFSTKQVQALRRNVDIRHVRTREVQNRELTYIEGWYAISEANRIFGFDGWNRETVESKCILARETRGIFLAIYTTRVRITVNAGGAFVIREGQGTGEGRSASPGEVHDLAIKSAETDATKRALATFGKPFGLALYSNGKTTSVPLKPAPESTAVQSTRSPPNLPPDDTTPIPRPSKYYGRPQDLVTKDRAQAARDLAQTVEASLVPSVSGDIQKQIDKSVLTFGEPKRLRDKAHLRFVSSQPCLICGRTPSDAHHLRFAQPRAIGLKVSDEFTVPLCRTHHQQIHQTGNELGWWDEVKINALDVAHQLWQRSRIGKMPAESQNGQSQ